MLITHVLVARRCQRQARRDDRVNLLLTKIVSSCEDILSSAVAARHIRRPVKADRLRSLFY